MADMMRYNVCVCICMCTVVFIGVRRRSPPERDLFSTLLSAHARACVRVTLDPRFAAFSFCKVDFFARIAQLLFGAAPGSPRDVEELAGTGRKLPI